MRISEKENLRVSGWSCLAWSPKVAVKHRGYDMTDRKIQIEGGLTHGEEAAVVLTKHVQEN